MCHKKATESGFRFDCPAQRKRERQDCHYPCVIGTGKHASSSERGSNAIHCTRLLITHSEVVWMSLSSVGQSPTNRHKLRSRYIHVNRKMVHIIHTRFEPNSRNNPRPEGTSGLRFPPSKTGPSGHLEIGNELISGIFSGHWSRKLVATCHFFL
jgi:hypothetical protein